MMAAGQVTHDEAITICKTDWWKSTPPGEAARFQLFQDRSVMPQGKFFEGLQVLFGREVLFRELKDIEALRAEFRARE